MQAERSFIFISEQTINLYCKQVLPLILNKQERLIFFDIS